MQTLVTRTRMQVNSPSDYIQSPESGNGVTRPLKLWKCWHSPLSDEDWLKTEPRR